MVVGNGFFSDTIQHAVIQMREKCGGKEVKEFPVKPATNLIYFVSDNAVVFGLQRVGDKFITRTLTTTKYSDGYRIRMVFVKNKEKQYKLQNIVFNTFFGGIDDDSTICFKDGNKYNCNKDNLYEKKREIDYSIGFKMNDYQHLYKSYFSKLVYTCNFFTGIPIEDAKDVVSNQFLKLCSSSIVKTYNDQHFVNAWRMFSKYRSLDFMVVKNRSVLYDDEYCYKRNSECFNDNLITKVIHGDKAKQYISLYISGMTGTEIADYLHTTYSNVSSSICRSLQKLNKYLSKEKEYLY